MSPNLHITDKRMLELMEQCTTNKLRGISTIKEWCETIGITPNNIFNIRKGTQQFTKDHIYNACVYYNIASDYIFGFTDNLFRINQKINPIDLIRQGLIEIENEVSKNKLKK